MNSRPFSLGRQRSGSTLLLVLVVVMLLSFSAYSFVELMLVELEATHVAVTQTQLRRLADSGIAAVTSNKILFETDQSAVGLNREVARSEFTVSSYSIIPSFSKTENNRIAAAVINESSKLNINSLPLDSFKRDAARNRLLHIPEMSEDVADAILDWLDEDDEPSQFGAESSYYLSLEPGYAPRQNHINTLSELLKVRGITSELLFGNDGQSGWSQFLTVDSKESNLTPAGKPKINLNSPDLDRLFSLIEANHGIEAAKFIVGWRLAGNANGSEGQRVHPNEDNAGQNAAKLKERRIATAQERLKQQLGRGRSRRSRSSTENQESSSSQKRRGGIDIGRPPAYAIRSIYDLIGTSVRISVNQKDTILKSPWSSESGDLLQVSAELESRLAVNEEPAQLGRININHAPFEVLLTVPGVDKALAEAIVQIRRSSLQSRTSDRMLKSVFWLVEEKLVDLKKLRVIAPFITTGGDVISGVSIGYRSDRAIGFAVGFTVDCAPHSRQILHLQDFGPIPWEVNE